MERLSPSMDNVDLVSKSWLKEAVQAEWRARKQVFLRSLRNPEQVKMDKSKGRKQHRKTGVSEGDGMEQDRQRQKSKRGTHMSICACRLYVCVFICMCDVQRVQKLLNALRAMRRAYILSVQDDLPLSREMIPGPESNYDAMELVIKCDDMM
jgi:hypothetical protein